jgi:hypothetical protein
MTTKLIDCNDDPVKEVFTPFYAACFGLSEIPNSLRGLVGPVTRPCSCPCYDFPDTPTEVSFVRSTQCDWSSAGNINWVCSAFDQPIVLFVAPWQDFYQNNANINPITAVFQLGQARNVTGSCSWNAETGQTTGQISGIVQFEPDCACPGQACEVAVTIFFGA